MFQIIAAKIFEERVIQAYQEKVGRMGVSSPFVFFTHDP